MTDTEALAREALERAQNWLDRSPDKTCGCAWCMNARELIRLRKDRDNWVISYKSCLARDESTQADNAALREDNAELNEAIKGWAAAERSWTEIRAGMDSDNAALRARVERLEAARDEMSKHMIVGLPDGNLQCMFCETIYPNEQMYLRELELTDKMGDQEAELATLRAQLAEAQAREAVLVGALTRISKSRLLDMDTLHPDACPSLAAETLANIPEATKAMGEVIEAAEAVANEFAQQHPLIKTLRTNLARLHAGRGA